MNGNVFGGLLAVALLGGAALVYATFFQVNQNENAIVLRFGQPVATVTTPGLHTKWPFLESVNRIDKRILDLDIPEREATASDQQRLVVDAFARYKITDPLKFQLSAVTVDRANVFLSQMLQDALLESIRSSTFIQVVRDRRDQIMARIREQANKQAQGFGIQIVDVRIRRADLPEENSKKVFERMSSERAQEAAQIRARGAEQALGIRARADRDVQVLTAEAERQAQVLRGEGDAEKTRILAEAFGSDAEFFSFYRSMQAYEQAVKGGTKLVLAPDSAFFRYFEQASGRPLTSGPTAAPTPAR